MLAEINVLSLSCLLLLVVSGWIYGDSFYLKKIHFCWNLNAGFNLLFVFLAAYLGDPQNSRSGYE